MNTRMGFPRSVSSATGHEGLQRTGNAECEGRRVRTGDLEDAQASGLPEDGIENWLVLSGIPQAVFHRCSCGCRFRWPTDARRIETRVGGIVEDAVELAYCPACKSVRLRLLKPDSDADVGTDVDGTETPGTFDPDSHTRIRAGIECVPPDGVTPQRVMADRALRSDLRRTLQDLTSEAASFSRAAEALEEAAGELPTDAISGDLPRSAATFQGRAVALAASLLAIVRSAERATTLAELGANETPGNDTTPDLNHSQASLEHSRESAVNALAAALIKTSGGDITHQEDLIPALHAAENVIDAIADYVLARQRSEFS